MPGILFEFEFLPTTSVYRLRYSPRNRVLIDILAVSGGVLSILSVVNYLMSSGAVTLVKMLNA